MKEIWAPELLIIFFLCIFFLRPFLKGLVPLEGITWMPFLALIITIGLFPAYGFRPECVPLLIFGFLLTIVNIPSMLSGIFSRSNDGFRDRSLIFTVPALVLLVFVSVIALMYAPLAPTGLVSEAVKTIELHNEAKNTDYSLRIYDSVDTRPLILVIPPDSGLVSAVDRVCNGLRDQGFSVISYSRKGSFSIYRSWQVFRSAHKTNKANNRGRALEAARREDLEFLLPLLQQNRGLDDVLPVSGTSSLIIIGYGAGGSAAVYLADSPNFAIRYGYVKGIIAVESGFYASYRLGERKKTPVSENATWFSRFKAAFSGFFAGFVPLKVAGKLNVPQPAIPVLHLTADYGASPLDFTDYPVTHPIYHVLFPGDKKAGQEKNRLQGMNRINDTVERMTNFAKKVSVTSLEYDEF